jgi:hypothetical protein
MENRFFFIQTIDQAKAPKERWTFIIGFKQVVQGFGGSEATLCVKKRKKNLFFLPIISKIYRNV